MNKEYDELINKYDLPNLEEFEKNFGFIDQVPKNHLINELRRKMVEKIDYFANLISDIIQPDTNISNIYEYRYLSDMQKKSLFNVFKILMFYSRKSSSLSTSYDEDKEVEFIKDFFDEWSILSFSIRKELDFLGDSWKDESEQEDLFENYMG